MNRAVDIELYQSRREILLASLPRDSVVILVGNTEQVRNKNINFPFRQDHDFYYMTGYDEPDAVAVLRPGSDQPFVLFNQPKDSHQEVWFGYRTGQAAAREHFGADQAWDINDLEQKLPELLGDCVYLYLSDEQGRFQHRVSNWLAQQRRSRTFDQVKTFRELRSVLPFIHHRRVIKHDKEVALLRHAISASVDGHKQLMRLCGPGISEKHMSGTFMGAVAAHDCVDVGYGNIIATGNNACCLHYTECRDILQDGQMILVDAGADYQYYTGDITRTYPVNGRFNGPQKDIYQLVLASLDEAISQVKPRQSWNAMYPAAMKVLAQGLVDLGILTGSLDQVMEQELYRPFTLHKTGHWLGLDVHDVGAYHDDKGQWKTLQPNMVFTIEPGLYFPEDCQQVAPQWRGMGVRIEDDILVTASGYENLSAGAPRTVADIEAHMNSG